MEQLDDERVNLVRYRILAVWHIAVSWICRDAARSKRVFNLEWPLHAEQSKSQLRDGHQMRRRHVPVSAMVKAPRSLMAFFAAAATIFVSACTWKEARHRLAGHTDPHATPAAQNAVAKLPPHCPERMPEATFLPAPSAHGNSLGPQLSPHMLLAMMRYRTTTPAFDVATYSPDNG